MFVVIELQKTLVNDSEVLSQITTIHETRSEAEQKYHNILSHAAVSGILSHSATMLDETGHYIKSENYPSD